MPTLAERLTKLQVGYYNASINVLDSENTLTTWETTVYLEEKHKPFSYWLYELRESVEYLQAAVYYLTHHSKSYPDYYNLYYILQELSEAGVTWQSIVEAWVHNDFEGRALTIATIDRMRQILWDEPFYVKWAARPEEQD